MDTKTTNRKKLSCDIKNMTLEEVKTIRDALAVLTEQKAERYGFKWNSEPTREKLLLSFIKLAEQMESLKNG